MMPEKRKTYTAEFKHDAVRLVTEQGYGVSAAARNVGLNINMRRRWKRELRERANGALPGQGHLSSEQEALHRLRDEGKRLRMERDIFKKAASFFANESK
jgi:transposase